jgi:hypothetical protein
MPTWMDFVTAEKTTRWLEIGIEGPQEVPHRQSIVLQVTQLRPAMRHIRAQGAAEGSADVGK